MKARNLSLAVLAAAAVAGAAADETPAATDAAEEKAPPGPYTAPALSGKANLLETFQDDEWSSRWIRATDEKYASAEDYTVANGDAPEGIANDKGLLFKSKAKHYGLSRTLDNPLSVSGDVVIQYEVRLQNGLDCGGAYLKLISSESSDADSLAKLKDDSPYSIMFGPDKCGTSSKIHFIFRHKNPKSGKIEEKHLKAPPAPKTDALSHLYTLVVSGTDYDILVDGSSVSKGSLTGDLFDPQVTPPAEIDDPTDSKPDDWVDEAKIPEPGATKPDDWDEDAPKTIEDAAAEKPSGWEDNEPDMVPDPSAKPPEDWDEEDDGEWEAPLVTNPKCAVGCGEWKRPFIDNPDYKGPWSAPIIDNPDYKGEWKARQIANPDFFETTNPFEGVADIGAVAVEVWTMSDQMHFDNILVTSDRAVADAFAAETYTIKAKTQLAEQAAVRSAEARKKREEEYDSGLAGKLNYYVGEAMDVVLNNPLISVPTVLVLLIASIWWCTKDDGEDDFHEPKFRPKPPPAKPAAEPTPADTTDAPAADADAAQEDKEEKKEKKSESTKKKGKNKHV